MASYKSRRNKDFNNPDEENLGQNQSFISQNNEKKKARDDSSKKLAQTAAKGAATYYGGQLGGKAVDAISNTKLGDKALNAGGKALNQIPGMGKAAKTLDDSGLVDKADKVMDMTGTAGSDNVSLPNAQTTPGIQEKGGSSSLGGRDSSSSSSKGTSILDSDKKDSDKNESSDSNKSNNFNGTVKIKFNAKTALIMIVPLIILILILIMVVSISSENSDYNDAFGISGVTKDNPGSEYITEAKRDKKAQAFYNRVYKVQLDLAEEGKQVDSLKIVAVYHIIDQNKLIFGHNSLNEADITEIANAMFEEVIDEEENKFYYYREDLFKQRLTNEIFPKYLPLSSEKKRNKMTEDVFDYIARYYEVIGYGQQSSCSDVGTCSYDIKGFAIYGKGNVTKDVSVSNLKVRLMQTGSGNGHDYGGTFGEALVGEDLVDFEKYILGVAYAEIGSDAPDEAIKAQMVAARSYILGRSTDMGGWRTLKEEGSGWVLQAANSTQDQVYCDPDKGCSSNDGQWGQVHSGLQYTGYRKPALPANSKMRSLANETMGELLTNDEGYVIYTNYTSVEQNQFIALAKQGLNYKQILMQVYNSSAKSYGASDIKKMTCNNSSGGCTNAVTGDFASWKQIEGPWINVQVGTSGRTIKQIGCLATSIAIQIARSGVPTNIQGEFNPGTFVEYLNAHNGFDGGNFKWSSASLAAPRFQYVDSTTVSGYTQMQKLSVLNSLLGQGFYVVAEVKGNTGQHWVAISGTTGMTVGMMDPGSHSTDMWATYNWVNTSRFAYFRVV